VNTSVLNGAPLNGAAPAASAARVTSFRSTGVVSSPSPTTDRRPDPGFSTGRAV
jgi:hypothetical protein